MKISQITWISFCVVAGILNHSSGQVVTQEPNDWVYLRLLVISEKGDQLDGVRIRLGDSISLPSTRGGWSEYYIPVYNGHANGLL